MSTSSSSDGASYVDMLYAMNDSNFGIPDRCPCGSAIIIQISTETVAIPKKYFVCKDFKKARMDRRYRRRNPTLEENAIPSRNDELRSLNIGSIELTKMLKNDGEIANLGYQIHEMEKVLKKNTEEIVLLKEIIEKL
ncbi:hypothetical protein Bca52824_073643 [Brassica carinata]|uniref:Uncharacterized protein n=1 Tax=Brassica carinata TaxID=52824 RepID=A0A8X7U617_BRACI|nr:hypothetical protein Bca52824_073643 [Brassica carinata]